MRSKDELKTLLSEIKSFYKAAFNRPFDPNTVTPHLISMREGRYNHFVKTRLGHLPDRDLLDFIDVIEADSKPEVLLPIEEAIKPVEVKKVGRPTKK